MRKPILIIISDTIRADLHRPLAYFRRFEVVHLYRQASYQDMTKADFSVVKAMPYKTPSDIAKILNRIRPTIVQLPEPTAGRRAAFTTLALLRVVKRVNAKVVVPFFENVPIDQKFHGLTRTFVKFVMRKLIAQADLLIYLNQGAKKNLESLGAPKEKLIQLFWGSWGVSGDFRPKLKVKSEKSKVVLYVGVLSRRKGLNNLVAAMEVVRKTAPQAQLWLVGPSGDFTPPTLSWIRTFGAVKNSKLPDFFGKASVFVLPSVSTPTWQEQVGMVNLQALASGVPVVTTKSGAIPEFVQDGQGVLLVAEHDNESLAKSIVKIFRLTPQKAKNFARLGSNFVKSRYSPQKNIQDIENFLAKTFL